MESVAYVLTSGWASGISVYGTLLVTGLLGRYGGVDRVPDVLERTDVLLVVAGLSAVEFVADKIPYVDGVWDAVHTAIRPVISGPSRSAQSRSYALSTPEVPRWAASRSA